MHSHVLITSAVNHANLLDATLKIVPVPIYPRSQTSNQKKRLPQKFSNSDRNLMINGSKSSPICTPTKNTLKKQIPCPCLFPGPSTDDTIYVDKILLKSPNEKMDH